MFNSYGRLHNESLLLGTVLFLGYSLLTNTNVRIAHLEHFLDYGFSLLDNEWDAITTQFILPPESGLFEEKRKLLNKLYFWMRKKISFSSKELQWSDTKFII